MAISQVGNIAYINQNSLLNAQVQATTLNQPAIASAVNLAEFNERMQENLEVRKTEELENVNKDGENQNQQEREENEKKQEKPINKKQNIYSTNKDIPLDIEV